MKQSSCFHPGAFPNQTKHKHCGVYVSGAPPSAPKEHWPKGEGAPHLGGPSEGPLPITETAIQREHGRIYCAFWIHQCQLLLVLGPPDSLYPAAPTYAEDCNFFPKFKRTETN